MTDLMNISRIRIIILIKTVITYPIDAKFHKRIIEGSCKIAVKDGKELHQSYSRTRGQLMIDQRYREHPKRRKKTMAAVAINKMKRPAQIRNAIFFVLDLLTSHWTVKYATLLIY